jgi:hypothetical protein
MVYFEMGSRRTRRGTVEQIQARHAPGEPLFHEFLAAPMPPKQLWVWLLTSIREYAKMSLERKPATRLGVRLVHTRRMLVPIENDLDYEDDMFDSDTRLGKLEPLSLFPDFFQNCGLL